MFVLLYRPTDDGVFHNFPKISENFPKLIRRKDERSRTFSENLQRFLKIAEDLRERPEDFSIIYIYTSEFKYNLRYKHDINEIIEIFNY